MKILCALQIVTTVTLWQLMYLGTCMINSWLIIYISYIYIYIYSYIHCSIYNTYTLLWPIIYLSIYLSTYIYIYIYTYICVIMKTMCPPGYHHNRFVATHALGHMMWILGNDLNIYIRGFPQTLCHDTVFVFQIEFVKGWRPFLVRRHEKISVGSLRSLRKSVYLSFENLLH